MKAARIRRWRAAVLLAIAFATTAMALTDLQWTGRPLVSVVFFLLVPGCAVVSYRQLDDQLAEVTLGAALSIAIGTAVAMTMLAVDKWNPELGQALLAFASAPLLIAQIRRHDEGQTE